MAEREVVLKLYTIFRRQRVFVLNHVQYFYLNFGLAEIFLIVLYHFQSYNCFVVLMVKTFEYLSK